MKTTILVLATIATLVLGGCATGANQGAGTPVAPATTAQGADPQAFLQAHGLGGLSAPQIIEKLEATQDDRTNGPVGSVRPNSLVLTDGNQQVTLPIEDRFYLSFAPYQNRTHDCFNHNLATCQGELTGTPVAVKIVDESGKPLVDQTVTTHANGFAGVWLPKDVRGTITVTVDGKQATSALSTAADAPTCLTTLKLT